MMLCTTSTLALAMPHLAANSLSGNPDLAEDARLWVCQDAPLLLPIDTAKRLCARRHPDACQDAISVGMCVMR